MNKNTPVIEVRNLDRHYPIKRLFQKNQIVKAVNDISFKLEVGKTLAIVGESGCGKTTLAKVLTMIDKPSNGFIFYDGLDLNQCSKKEKKELRKKIQIIFQNPYSSLNPRKKIGSIIGEPLIINTKFSAAERKKKVLAMMHSVGLEEGMYERYPHMFSGGQRQRIAIARALILKPKVVIADEPVSALDVSIQAQVLNLMKNLQDELKLAYIFISHDLSVVERIADKVIVMYLGEIVEQGKTQLLFDKPRHPYTQALLASTPKIDSKKRKKIKLLGEMPSPLQIPQGCPFQSRCRYMQAICKKHHPKLEIYDNRIVSCLRVHEIAHEQKTGEQKTGEQKTSKKNIASLG